MDANAPPIPLPFRSNVDNDMKNVDFDTLVFRGSPTPDIIKAQEHPVNPWTHVARKRTDEYFAILEKRKLLPVTQSQGEFYAMYKKCQVIIFSGETGSGKTTQIPQYVMYADLPSNAVNGKKIVCTQPRRIATREVATRVARELDVELGEEVGYAFRNEEKISASTKLIYTTDGRLVQEIGSDRLLRKYSCIIIDEAHERSETIDLLLGLLKPILERRPDLKLIIMSATLNAKTFQKHFPEAEKIEVHGQTFGCQIMHASWGEGMETSADYVVSAVRVVKYIITERVGEEIHSNTGGMGDILIFVPGEEDIRRTRLGILHEFPQGYTVVGLHGSMSKEKQQQALLPVSNPKIIVATDIAETSLTIDGVVHVIDTGLTKEMSYNPRLNLWTLAIEPISQASAKQRAGRCGRTRPGFCWRLYGEGIYNTVLLKNPLPRILRGDMMGMVLDLVSLGRDASAATVRDFPFIDKPSPEVTIRAWWSLQNLGCLDQMGQITHMGQFARRLPLDPYHAMAVARAVDSHPGPVWEILAIVSMLNEDGVFIRPGHFATYADVIREFWSSAHGDHFTLLKVFQALMYEIKECNDKEMNKPQIDAHIEKWCDDNYLNFAKIQSAYATFTSISRSAFMEIKKFDAECEGLEPESERRTTAEYVDVIKQILLRAGFLHIAVKDPKDPSGQTYRTLEENQPALVHPASVINRGYKHDFIFYDKFIDSGKPYLMDATGFDPDWLFEDGVTSAYVAKLLDSDRLPRSENFVSLQRLELARTQYKSTHPSKKM